MESENEPLLGTRQPDSERRQTVFNESEEEEELTQEQRMLATAQGMLLGEQAAGPKPDIAEAMESPFWKLAQPLMAIPIYPVQLVQVTIYVAILLHVCVC